MYIFARQREAIRRETDRLKEQGIPISLEELNRWYPVLSGANGAAAYRAAFAALEPAVEEPETALQDLERRTKEGLPFWTRLQWRAEDSVRAAKTICSRLYWEACRILLPHRLWQTLMDRRVRKLGAQLNLSLGGVRVPRKPELPIIDGESAMPGRGPLPAETRQELETYAAKKARGLELLYEAMTNPYCRFEPDWSDGVNDCMTCQRGVHAATKALGVQALLAADNGDSTLAAQALCDALAVIPTLRSIPNYMGMLVEISCAKIVLEVLEWALNRTRFAAGDLEKILAALEQFEDRDMLRRAYIGERCFGMCCSDPTAEQGDWTRRVYDWLFDVPAQLQYLKTMQSCIEGTMLQPADQWDACSRIVRQIQLMSRYLTPIRERLNSHPMYFAPAALHRVRLGLARAALAVEAFQVKTGHLPEDLEQLVPDFLHEMPRDITGKSAIHYERNGSGYAVASEGVTESLGEGIRTTEMMAENLQMTVIS